MACNGSSGENDDKETSTPVATSFSLATLNAQGQSQLSFDKNESVLVQAIVYDQFSAPINGARINFTTDLGSLTMASKLSDDQGIAQVEITNSALILSAGTITANLNETSKSVNFEYINNAPAEMLPNISIQMSLNGILTNQFKADEQVQVSFTLLDDQNQPITDELIQVNADIGQLDASTTLTQANGKASITLSGSSTIGAGVLTATLSSNNEVISRMNYQVVPADSIITDEVRLGYFNDNGDFIEGEIKVSVNDNTISAGGTLGLTIDLVDSANNRINTPTPVSFTSNCVINGNATIDESVFSINGRASATFEDVNCAGSSGTEDVIIASVTANNITNTASQTINITGEELGSIEFISAEPASIVLKGSGGQETSTLTFMVKSALGNELAQQTVNFNLDTDVGGIALSRNSGLTNSQGLITTQVLSGTVPTAVSVTAVARMEVNGESIEVQTQSNQLTVNTGLAEQRSLTIAASVLNPEADFNGETSQITAWLADNFNNPVPDGTSVNFTTEGGVIESTCNTVNGSCSVTWTSAEPRLPNHRSTILASALGHESFFDNNGNNIFDDEDGIAIIDAGVSSGFSRHNAEPSGFIDMSEAWRDDNENFTYDAGELFLDYDNNGAFDLEDNKFNGPQCQGSRCADASMQAIHVRKALVLIMSGSSADYILSDANSGVIYHDSFGNNNPVADIANGGSTTFTFQYSDLANQTLPLGTTIAVSSSAGTLAGQTSVTVGNNNNQGYGSLSFVLSNPVDDDLVVATITITITTPKGITTSMLKTVVLP